MNSRDLTIIISALVGCIVGILLLLFSLYVWRRWRQRKDAAQRGQQHTDTMELTHVAVDDADASASVTAGQEHAGAVKTTSHAPSGNTVDSYGPPSGAERNGRSVTPTRGAPADASNKTTQKQAAALAAANQKASYKLSSGTDDAASDSDMQSGEAGSVSRRSAVPALNLSSITAARAAQPASHHHVPLNIMDSLVSPATTSTPTAVAATASNVSQQHSGAGTAMSVFQVPSADSQHQDRVRTHAVAIDDDSDDEAKSAAGAVAPVRSLAESNPSSARMPRSAASDFQLSPQRPHMDSLATDHRLDSARMVRADSGDSLKPVPQMPAPASEAGASTAFSVASSRLPPGAVLRGRDKFLDGLQSNMTSVSRGSRAGGGRSTLPASIMSSFASGDDSQLWVLDDSGSHAGFAEGSTALSMAGFSTVGADSEWSLSGANSRRPMPGVHRGYRATYQPASRASNSIGLRHAAGHAGSSSLSGALTARDHTDAFTTGGASEWNMSQAPTMALDDVGVGASDRWVKDEDLRLPLRLQHAVMDEPATGLRERYAQQPLRLRYAADDTNVPQASVDRVSEWMGQLGGEGRLEVMKRLRTEEKVKPAESSGNA